MTDYVALLRGINVGGNNILPMKQLRGLLTSIGCKDVSTYIQSGNAVFRHDKGATALSALITATIESQFGFASTAMVLRGAEFLAVAEGNPFAERKADPKFLHISFLRETAVNADLQRLNELKANDEEFVLTDSAFYLYAPSGIGRSKMAANVEKCLGVQATGRNLRSVGKIGELLAGLS